MTTRQERDRVLQGQDPMVNAIIGYLLAQGWYGDRILKNVAGKVYWPNRATVRVSFDSAYQQYWVSSEYTSAGENVLAGCILCIKSQASSSDVVTVMSRFLEEAESRINQSFAVRFLGNPRGDGSLTRPQVSSPGM